MEDEAKKSAAMSGIRKTYQRKRDPDDDGYYKNQRKKQTMNAHQSESDDVSSSNSSSVTTSELFRSYQNMWKEHYDFQTTVTHQRDNLSLGKMSSKIKESKAKDENEKKCNNTSKHEGSPNNSNCSSSNRREKDNQRSWWMWDKNGRMIVSHEGESSADNDRSSSCTRYSSRVGSSGNSTYSIESGVSTSRRTTNLIDLSNSCDNEDCVGTSGETGTTTHITEEETRSYRNSRESDAAVGYLDSSADTGTRRMKEYGTRMQNENDFEKEWISTLHNICSWPNNVDEHNT